VLEPQASRLTALLGYDHVPVDGCSRVFGGTEYNRQAGRPWSQRKRSNFISRALHGKVENPTHGSAGIVQVRPTKGIGLKVIRIPPTAVGGFVQVQPSVCCDNGNCNLGRSVTKYPTVSSGLEVEAGPEPSTNCRWWD